VRSKKKIRVGADKNFSWQFVKISIIYAFVDFLGKVSVLKVCCSKVNIL
jgi:hypothetical protein